MMNEQRELCSVCGGNGVVKIPGGVSVCDHCHGDSWEPQDTRLAALERQLGEKEAEIVKLRERSSHLEDAAFHYQNCRTCAEDGEDSCESGRWFAAYLRGEEPAA